MNLGRRLPPFDALIVFETAVRVGSFSSAGRELGLTQSAVSRQIAKLEAFLGDSLFLRSPTGVQLTSSGETYASEIARLLNDMAGVTDSVRAWRGPRQVTIACSRGIGDMWLMPRLPSMNADIPGLELRLRVTDDLDHLRLDEFDLAIFYRRDAPTGVHAVRLGNEEIVPVTCPGGAMLADMRPPTLLAIEDPRREWMGWSDWCRSAEVALPEATRHWRLGDYRFAVEAAAEGIGIALGWTWMIRQQLEDGRLVEAHSYRFRSNGGFYVMRSAHRHARRIVREIEDWLIASNRCAESGRGLSDHAARAAAPPTPDQREG
ncbi:LysR substrate-binding domain-containing protein [Aureimonas glaciei]|uniref:LysR family transcriptional regulator n=1 Tax=Aureimonas glaciei TaxID=1776957 RepID=A0A916XSQ6_9HYPH|nr:LysR substrate-binding domain-containing protein [Aureimonas glaciei]GGD04992.1 LysR family transcriptional regulator [Aureimonas glaciei]